MSTADTVKQFYALVNGDAEGQAHWRASVAEAWTASPAFPAAPTQVAGYPLAIGALRKGFPDLKFHLEEIVTRDNFVAVRCTVRGTHTGEFMGIPATNKAVSFTAMDIHKIDQGVILETWHAEDFTKMIAQLKA
jgi:predicted ester cyclase